MQVPGEGMLFIEVGRLAWVPFGGGEGRSWVFFFRYVRAYSEEEASQWECQADNRHVSLKLQEDGQG